MKKCKNCGAKLNKKDKFCSVCGMMIKKRKKKMMVFLGILVGIIFVSVIVVTTLSKTNNTPKRVVKTFLDAYKNSDGETCGRLLYNNPSEEKIEFSDTQKLLGANISYTIKKVSDKNEYWEIDTEIKNIDFAQIGESFGGDNSVSVEDIHSAIKNEEGKEKTYKCKIIVRKAEKEYKIVMTPEFSNALLGGINEYINEVISGGR